MLLAADNLAPTSPRPDVRGMEIEDTVEIMTSWFFENFEDPAHQTPWDEGEYLYIHGGPYDAREELYEAFDDIACDWVIEAAVNEIEYQGFVWAPARNRILPPED
jgi:hypothetical protein